MPSSPIRKLAKYADAAKRNGVHVYHLNIGQPDILTPECALEAVRNIDRKVLEYSPSQGYKSLRTKMVGYYAEYGIDLSPDEIIVTTGGSEAVMFAYMACLNPGDEVRLAYVLNKEDLGKALVVLEKALDEYGRR